MKTIFYKSEGGFYTDIENTPYRISTYNLPSFKLYFENHVKNMEDFTYSDETNDWSLDQRPYKKICFDFMEYLKENRL